MNLIIIIIIDQICQDFDNDNGNRFNILGIARNYYSQC